MDTGVFLILILAILCYLYYTSKIQVRIIKTIYFSKNQKILNSVFIWIVPFIWGFIVKSILKQKPSGTITKEQRKTDPSNFYESNIGGLYGGD